MVSAAAALELDNTLRMARPRINSREALDDRSGGAQAAPAGQAKDLPHATEKHPLSDDDRFSRTNWLAGVLRERILNGTYRPGERIREIQLRSEFGFSNGPIREALQAIVADGLAERAPWLGVRVKTLSEQELIELFQVRLALLEYTAELAARNISAEAVESAKALKRDLDAGFEQVEREGGHLAFNGTLSRWLLTTAGNAALKEIWDKTMQQTLIYVNASLTRSHGRKTRSLINKLVDAICDGDIPTARATARTLTEQTLVDLGIQRKL